jgi:16S rRNA (guanine527-N7)-methyltransferase
VAVAVPAPPAAARELFGPSLPRAELYAGLLVSVGVERGLIGPRETARIWDRHLINSGLVAELLPAPAGQSVADVAVGGRRNADGSRVTGGRRVVDPPAGAAVEGSGQVADLGSGAGLPGLVVAILRPDLHVTLVEPMARRTAFLAECAEELELGNVQICRGRAEELAGQIQADVVMSRAVARLGRLAELSAGLCRPGGLVLAIKGDSAAAELEQARAALRRLGATEAEVVVAGRELVRRGLVERATTVVRFRIGRAGMAAERSAPHGQRRNRL